MRFVAWLAAEGNQLGADPGIVVRHRRGLDVAVQPASAALLAGTRPGDYADALLSAAGFTRSGEWIESGGQWAANATPKEPRNA